VFLCVKKLKINKCKKIGKKRVSKSKKKEKEKKKRKNRKCVGDS
jgi:hypothetical protein